MASQSIGTCEASAAAPLTTLLQVAFAHELLLARMQTLMPLAVMLARESFPTYCTNERSFIRMSAKMRSQIVGSSEALGAKSTLEGGRVLLDTSGSTVLDATTLARLVFGVACKTKY